MKTPNWEHETDVTTGTDTRDDPCIILVVKASRRKHYFPYATPQPLKTSSPNPTLACSGHYFPLFHPLFAHLGREGKIVGVPLDSPSKWRTGGINVGAAKKHCLDQFDSGGCHIRKW